MAVSSSTQAPSVRLSLLVASNNEAVLAQRLLSSPDVLAAPKLLTVVRNASSAADAFNPVLAQMELKHAEPVAGDGPSDWLVWVHQDVHLPSGWLQRTSASLAQALHKWPRLAVAGAYGLAGSAEEARRAGALLDRGNILQELAPLPHKADSLDELMVAVRVGSGLRMDPALGFDFYATDLCLQAHEQGMDCAVIDAWCEHWSSTPRSGAVPVRVLQRIKQSAEAFEHKWAHRLPVSTPCFDIRQAGDVAAFLAAHTTSVP